MKPDESNDLVQLQDCLKNINVWTTQTFLLLNSDKTEVIAIGPKHLRETISDQIVTLDHIILVPSSTVRTLGVMFDQDMSFDPHIKQGQLSSTCAIVWKLGTSCPRRMLRNWSMHLLPLDWITVILYYQDVTVILCKASSWYKMLQHESWQELEGEFILLLS